MEQVYTGIQLNQKGQETLQKYKRPVFICLAAIAVISLAVLFTWTAARNGMAVLCNKLFEASERLNAYAYERLAVLTPADPVAAAILLGLIIAVLIAAAIIIKSRLAAVLFMLILAGGEIYFGITFPLPLNILLFALPGLMLLKNLKLHTAIIYTAAIMVILLFFSFAFPSVDMGMETASELVRDHFGRIEHTIGGADDLQDSNETRKTRKENRLDKQDAGLIPDESQRYNEYRSEQELEQEISIPKKINYMKLVLITLLILALFIVPFLPFLLLESRRRRALARRALFQSEDCAESIRAMFLHMNTCLERQNHVTVNRQFSDCADEIAKRWSKEYANHYIQAVGLWQEAAYSSHTMTQSQRDAMREILDETENMVYDNADRKTKFKLKYIECLHA